MVDRATAPLMAREEHESLDCDRTARAQSVVREKRHHLLARRRSQPGQRDMGRELARLGLESDALQRGLDFLLQVKKCAVGPHTGPQRARILSAELANARQLELERWSTDARQRVVDVVRYIL